MVVTIDSINARAGRADIAREKRLLPIIKTEALQESVGQNLGGLVVFMTGVLTRGFGPSIC